MACLSQNQWQRVHYEPMTFKNIHGLSWRCYSSLWTQNACYVSYTATLEAFLLGFYLKNRAPPAKNGSKTATITIKPRGGRKVLTFANHLEGLIIFTNEAQCSQCIHNTTMNIIKPSRWLAKVNTFLPPLYQTCVEQDLLYPWMCYTSLFELHRSQDEHFSAPSHGIFSKFSLKVTFLLCQTGACLLW